MDRQKIIGEIIYKLTLSGFPPSFQEYLIDNLSKIETEELEKIIIILDKVAEKQIDYLKAQEDLEKIFEDLGMMAKNRIIQKEKEIREALDKELEEIDESLKN